MKKISINKIALALFIAGYGINSAYALTASTQPIQGNVPLVNSSKASEDNFSNNSVDIKVTTSDETTSANGKWKPGYKVILTYKTVDEDGDYESDAKETAQTVFFTYYKNGKWIQSSTNQLTQEKGKVTWVIPNEAVGATQIAYTIRPTTQYGDPFQNNWQTGLINSKNDPIDGGDKNNDPNNPIVPTTPSDPSKPIDPNNPGTIPGTGGESDKGTGPVLPSDNSLTIEIHKVILSGGEIQEIGESYSSEGSTLQPKIGESFVAQVKDINDANSDYTTNYTYKWSLSGKNSSAKGETTANTTEVVGYTPASGKYANTQNVVYIISKNDVYDYEAGAQGFALQVDATEK